MSLVIHKCYELIEDYFRDEPSKIGMWFNASNPLLGNVSPIDMIRIGREEKLLDFIESHLDGNHP